MPATKDLSNRDLDRRIRWDLVVSILLVAVPLSIGGIYALGQIASDVEGNTEVNIEQTREIKQIRESQQETKDDISKINTDVAVIKNDVKNMKESVDKDLEEIKQILRERQ